MKRTPLKLPLTGEANKPMYDSAGKLVSIVEWAEQFAAAMNLVWLISERALDTEDSDARAVAIIAEVQQSGEAPDRNDIKPSTRIQREIVTDITAAPGSTSAPAPSEGI